MMIGGDGEGHLRLAASFGGRGFLLTLNSAGVLLKPTTDSSRFFSGNLGIDLFTTGTQDDLRFLGNDAYSSIVFAFSFDSAGVTRKPEVMPPGWQIAPDKR